MAQLLPHFFMPGRIRLGLEVFSGILDLISLSFRFDGLLYAVKGGRGNISARWGSTVTMVLQCFLRIFVMHGSLGS